MDIEIRKAELTDIDLLMKWRMRVLREVFAIPENEPAEELERKNRIYYQSANINLLFLDPLQSIVAQ